MAEQRATPVTTLLGYFKMNKMTQYDKKQLMLSHLRSLIDNDLHELKELSSLVENFLRKEFHSTLERAEKEIADDLPEDEQYFLEACYSEDLQKIEKLFPRIQRYSLFTTAMSMIEGSVVTLCRGAKQIFNLTEEFDTKKPNVINRGIKYLENNLGIITNRYKHYIAFVDSLRKVRNCIVHEEGRVSGTKDESDIRSFISSIPTIELDKFDRIVILEGFIDSSSHTANLLIQRLFDSIRSMAKEFSK